MPRRRRNKRRGKRRSGPTTRGGATRSSPTEIPAMSLFLGECLRTATADTFLSAQHLAVPSSKAPASTHASAPGFETSQTGPVGPSMPSDGKIFGVLDSDDEKDEKKVYAPTDRVETAGQYFRRRQRHDPPVLVELRLLRSVFKADHPYRTRVTLHQGINTTGAGVVNFTFPVSNVSTTAEWTSIDALFDEFFLHEVVMHYRPVNAGGHSGMTTGTNTIVTDCTSTTQAPNAATNCGLIVISLFGGSGYYTAASGMSNNPTRAYHNSYEHFTYRWRNNVKFRPNGEALTPTAGLYWAGWTTISSANVIAGNIQMRAVNDRNLGDATHTWTLGDASFEFDVSFRQRA